MNGPSSNTVGVYNKCLCRLPSLTPGIVPASGLCTSYNSKPTVQRAPSPPLLLLRIFIYFSDPAKIFIPGNLFWKQQLWKWTLVILLIVISYNNNRVQQPLDWTNRDGTRVTYKKGIVLRAFQQDVFTCLLWNHFWWFLCLVSDMGAGHLRGRVLSIKNSGQGKKESNDVWFRVNNDFKVAFARMGQMTQPTEY